MGTFQCAGLSSDCAAFATELRPLPAVVAEDFQYRPGILHYAYLTVPLTSVTCAPSPCGPALPVARLAGRYSCDYYGHSVAIGLASRRRSHVHKCYTSERDLGVPFASFNALTGHRSCVPEEYGMLL